MSTRLGAIVDRLAREGLLRDDRIDDAIRAIEIGGIAADSRRVARGDLFIAVTGTTEDGRRYLRAARDSGAVAALVEEPDADLPFPQVVVTSSRLAAATAAAEFFGDPWRDLTLVAVTGTNGKTTSVAILRHMFARRAPSASIGTLGVVAADGRSVPGTEGLTTPGPVDLARWLRQLRDDGVRTVAMELSSHALDQGRAAAVRYDAALFTNLSREHLDYHGTMERYRAAKLRLIELIRPGGTAVINGDEPAWGQIAAGAARRVVFGTGSAADVRAEQVSLDTSGVTWMLVTPDGSVRVRLPLLGSYNVANALGVAAVLWSLGWEIEAIAEGLAAVPQVPGRLERVPTPEGAPAVLIDYAHTPDALERALAAVRPLARGRLIVVFGAGGDRDRGKRPEMGRIAASLADECFVTSDNPRTEDPEVIIDEIEAGMGAARRRRIVDRREAIEAAIGSAAPDDVVLLAGKGHENYQIRGTDRFPFDERIIVAEHFDEGRIGA